MFCFVLFTGSLFFFWWGRVLNKSWYKKNRWKSRCIKNPAYLLYIGDEILGSYVGYYNNPCQKEFIKGSPRKKNQKTTIWNQSAKQKKTIGIISGCFRGLLGWSDFLHLMSGFNEPGPVLLEASVCLLGVYFASGWPKAKRKSRWGLLVGADRCGCCCWSPPHSEIVEMQRMTKWRDFVGQWRGFMNFEFWITFVLKGLKGCFGNDHHCDHMTVLWEGGWFNTCKRGCFAKLRW